MKKILLVLFLVMDIVVMILYFNLNKDYIVQRDILIDKLDGSSYEDKMIDLNNQYDNVINDIANISGYEIDDDSKFEDIINDLNSEYDELVSLNNDLTKNKELLSKQRTTLKNTYNKLLEEQIKKSTFIINGVPKINQYSLGYPTGCESAALTALLKYWGVNVSMSSVVKVLPKGNLPYYENGIKYGGNPYLEFVGTPSSYSSYGVYEKPILQVAESFKSGVINGTGMKLDEVLKIVSQNRPVLVWVSMNMSVPYISTSWIYKPTGEKISWMSGEHALVIIGYNQTQVIVSDSFTGGVRYYDKGVFESRYNTYGKRAVYY